MVKQPITISHKQLILLFLFVVGTLKINAQCPSISNVSQSFCDIDGPIISDLIATDNGNGIFWYDTPTSTTPISNSDGLVSGEDYYADDATGTCGTRERVDVFIYGAPFGLNFQGVCVDDVNDATISDLNAFGNDVQWYSVPLDGIALLPTTILNDNTIYYADQENPDTNCRTSRLSVLVNVGLVPVPTGDTIQEFCSDNAPTVADLVALGFNNWYATASSVNPLDETEALIDGENYFATTVDPPCESDSRLEVTVVINSPANSGTDGVLDICETDIITIMSVDLIDSLLGSPDTDGFWSGPFPTANGSIGTLDITSLTVAGGPYVFTYQVDTSTVCGSNTSTVTITIIPTSDAGTDGAIEVCTNNDPLDLFTILGGSPQTDGTWSPALASGTGLFDPSVDTDGTYTYTVGNAPCEVDFSTVTVTTTIPLDPGTNATVDLCTNNDPIDLFTILGGSPETGGIWSPALASGTGIFNPTLDAAGVYTYTLIGTPPCEDQSATVTVTFIPTPDAGVDGAVDLCLDNDPIDLFTILGGSPETGGTWTPSLASGTGIFDPSLDTSGVYTYTIPANPPCEDSSATVTVTTNIPPDPGTNATLDLCTNNDPIDLFTFLGGSPETGGTWTPALASGTGFFDPSFDAAGVYTYTLTGTPPCEDQSATVTVTFISTPDAGTDGAVDLCLDNDPIDLFTILGGSPETGGTWTPALASGTGIFDPSLDTSGVYTYTIPANPPCEDSSATVTVTTNIPPDPGTNATVDLCTNNDPIDLFSVLGGSPETGGSWSPALASGTGLFDPTLDAAGVYTYTLIGTPPCEDQSATVTVTFIPTPDAGTDGAIDLCLDNNSIDLFTILGGSPETGGTWTPALASGTGIFNPNVDSAGIYTYTIAANPPCEDSSATVTVTTNIPPDPGTNATVDLCTNNDPTDLFTILGGSPETGGTWTPTLASGTGFFDPSFDAAGVYTYTLTGTPPCEDQFATVTVTFISTPDAGTDGTIDLCTDSDPIDIFTILGGSPETGGTWTPALTSGTSVFDPNVDSAGIYTYTIAANPPCEDSSAIVTVTIIVPPDPGTNATVDLCTNNDPIDIFTILGGSPETGGTWTPALASGTGLFDPTLDAAGVYTYSLTGTPPCEDQSATVTITFIATPDAGTDGAIDLCTDNDLIDLFTILGGTPETGGTWTPALASNTGVFDPSLDIAGAYTYTIAANPPCEDSSATVTVTTNIPPDPGTNATVDLCNNGGAIDLFTILGGSPETGGTWTPTLASGTGLFDPNIDVSGIYNYTLTATSPCEDQSATVTVTVIPPPNAGEDSDAVICIDDGAQDLFNYLNGTPDSGGTWSPALASGTGLFDPNVDIAGMYTYTVTGPIACNQSDAATLTVSIEINSDATGLEISSEDICLGLSNDIVIINAPLLIDGSFALTYNLSGANQSDNTTTIIILNGVSVFNIPANLLTNLGLTTVTITSITNINSICGADVSTILSSSFTVLNSITPELIENGNMFCLQDEPTIENLSSNIITTEIITWYDAPINGNSYGSTDALVDGQTYYASALSDDGCESTIRLEVTVMFEDCPLEFIIPDGFSPNDDSINDEFTIVNLRELYPNFTLEIYNRHGNILYKGDINIPDWDGTSDKGVTLGDSRLPVGVYFFILEFNDGNRNPIQGRLYLSR